MKKSMRDEYLDLVNKNDIVIGKKKRADIYSEKLNNFRVINAFLINSKGELWIPTRSAQKRIFPLCLDMSMGGHVESGESYDEAFKRELAEELNLNTSQVPHRLLGHLTPDSHGVSAFMQVYEIQSDVAPAYNTNDFIEYVWISPKELQTKIQQGTKAKEDLPKLLKIFYLGSE